jgi:hypothetical protein
MANREVAVDADILENKTAMLSGGKLLVLGEKAVSVYQY